jgi:ribosome-binding factor A
MNKYRIERVKRLLKEEISLILHNNIKDPRIGFVTITDVEVSKDLRYAEVFVSVMGTSKEKEDTIIALKKAEGFVWRILKDNLNMKYIPKISFSIDNSLERGSRVLSLLEMLKKS